MTHPRPVDVTVDDFRALARSGPWLWETLSCVVRPAAGDDFEFHAEPLRIHTDRVHGALRVETLDGTVLHESRQSSQGRASMRRALLLDEAPAGSMPGMYTDAGTPAPLVLPPETDRRRELLDAAVRRPDGLVLDREDWGGDLDVPRISSYLWVAVCDPRELADGQDRDDDGPDDGLLAGCDLTDLRVETTDGREQWAATVIPTSAYDPRCSCCPLLPGQAAGELMVRTGERDTVPENGTRRFDVWLDRATGIVTRLRHLDGADAGKGFDLTVEAVATTVGEPGPATS